MDDNLAKRGHSWHFILVKIVSTKITQLLTKRNSKQNFINLSKKINSRLNMSYLLYRVCTKVRLSIVRFPVLTNDNFLFQI